MRIGQGIDVHRVSDDADRVLWLGLVRVPGSGLVGHSDADVATHALCDALLGAACLGDLGRHFPDTDPVWKDVSSRELLTACVALVESSGYRCISADVTIVAEAPMLAPYVDDMVRELSNVLNVRVSLKATRAEGLGALGRVEGIGASAVVLIEEK